MSTLGHICFETRARAAKSWYLGAIFTPKKKNQFNIMQTDFWWKIWNFETICNRITWGFFDCLLRTLPIWLQRGRKTQNWRENVFLLNVCGFYRDKNSKNSDRDGQNYGHLVQQVKLFLDQGLLIKGQPLSPTQNPTPLRGFGICGEKKSKYYGRNSQDFGHLVQLVTKDLRYHKYPSVSPQ